MSDFQEKAFKHLGLDSTNPNFNITDSDIWDLSNIQTGYDICQKEYEEKLRWIPVEEKLPDIYCCEIAVRKQRYEKTEIKIFLHSGQFKQFCKNHGYTEWRYFL